jgi:GTPase SAR1 family protein
LSYVGTDLFLLCFDIGNLDSLVNASERWLKELTNHASNVPILLCGTKLDLRKNPKYLESFKNKSSERRLVTFDQGLSFAKKMNAVGYAETSSKDGDGVEEVFNEVMKSACQFFQFQRERKNNCNFM